MGKDLLEQDYILKRLSASITHPESSAGKDYWQEVYQKIAKINGTTKVPVNTFNKIWIMPDKAVINEDNGLAIITQSSLKAMIDEDYLALQKSTVNSSSKDKINSAANQAMREIILPKIQEDINRGENFAVMRQIYNSMLLALWFKKKFQDSFYKYYIDQNKVSGIDLQDKTVKDKIFKQYVESFKQGIYDYIKTDTEPTTKKSIKRRYFSGGFDARQTRFERTSSSSADAFMNELRGLIDFFGGDSINPGGKPDSIKEKLRKDFEFFVSQAEQAVADYFKNAPEYVKLILIGNSLRDVSVPEEVRGSNNRETLKKILVTLAMFYYDHKQEFDQQNERKVTIEGVTFDTRQYFEVAREILSDKSPKDLLKNFINLLEHQKLSHLVFCAEQALSLSPKLNGIQQFKQNIERQFDEQNLSPKQKESVLEEMFIDNTKVVPNILFGINQIRKDGNVSQEHISAGLEAISGIYEISSDQAFFLFQTISTADSIWRGATIRGVCSLNVAGFRILYDQTNKLIQTLSRQPTMVCSVELSAELNRSECIARAKQVLIRKGKVLEFTPRQEEAIWQAHSYGKGKLGKPNKNGKYRESSYTPEEQAVKTAILKGVNPIDKTPEQIIAEAKSISDDQALFSQREITKLKGSGVVGNPGNDDQRAIGLLLYFSDRATRILSIEKAPNVLYAPEYYQWIFGNGNSNDRQAFINKLKKIHPTLWYGYSQFNYSAAADNLRSEIGRQLAYYGYNRDSDFVRESLAEIVRRCSIDFDWQGSYLGYVGSVSSKVLTGEQMRHPDKRVEEVRTAQDVVDAVNLILPEEQKPLKDEYGSDLFLRLVLGVDGAPEEYLTPGKVYSFQESRRDPQQGWHQVKYINVIVSPQDCQSGEKLLDAIQTTLNRQRNITTDSRQEVTNYLRNQCKKISWMNSLVSSNSVPKTTGGVDWAKVDLDAKITTTSLTLGPAWFTKAKTVSFTIEELRPAQVSDIVALAK
jgi:hypothetical protein